MLPSRGLARNPASRLRYSLATRTKAPRTAPTRQFSQAQSPSPSSSRHGLSLSSSSPLYSSRSKLAIGPGSSVGIASGVFAQRSGAARNLSFWGIGGSKTETPKPVETATESSAVVPPAAEAPTPVAEANVTGATQQADLSSQIPEDVLRELEPHSLVDIPERIGFLKELGLDFGWGPTSCCEWLVEHIHVMSGMPWWGTIATVALLFRAAMFWPTLSGSKHQALLQKVQQSPAYIKAKARFDEAAFRTKDQSAMLHARSDMKRLMQRSGASFWRPFIGMAMFPFSIGMFRLIRGMAGVPVPSMEVGGLAWFSDLTVPDPLYILPTVSVGLGVLMFKLMRQANAGGSTNPMQDSMMKIMTYVMPPLMFAGTAWLPAGLQWFFLNLSIGSVIQSLATINPTIRRWAGLPPLGAVAKGASGQIQYQAPTTTAAAKPGFLEAASKTFKESTGVTDQKERWKKAQEYEKRRAEEEQQKTFRRLEEARRRRNGTY
ncbi:hypothetical protein F5Y17DRAFT_432451 [Xylariaceae sp. FL0594]|nr:hypothetical protein F5Y17DRAFT_432451 [Xylariaceae sp. FL0594]